MQAQTQLIDIITYLASLVSNPEAVDPILDTLRVITAQLPENGQLSDAKLGELEKTRSQLESYLLHDDPVRAFTTEQLQHLVASHVSGGPETAVRHSTLRQVGVICLSMFATYAVVGVIFTFAKVRLPWLLAGMMGMVAMYVGLIWFYWSGLATFTQQLRRAYLWIVVGIGLMGIFSPPAGIFVIFPSIIQHTLFSYVGAFPAFSLSFFFVYYGLCVFARTVGVRSLFSSWRVMTASALALSLLATLLPHDPNFETIPLAIGMVTMLSMGLFGVLAGQVAFSIRQKVTGRYSRALVLLGVAYALAGAVMLFGAGMINRTGPPAGLRLAVIVVPSMVAGMLVFLSGYYFKRNAGEA